MSEKLELDLSINAKAAGAIAEMKKLESQASGDSSKIARQWENTFAKIATAEYRKSQTASKAYEKTLQSAYSANKKFDERRVADQKRAAHKAAEHNSILGGIKEATGIGKIASGAFIGATLAEAFIGGAEKAVDLLKDGIKDAFNAAAKEETLRLAYKLTLGAKAGQEAREDAERFSKIAGISASKVQGQLLPLFNAGVRGQAARSAYALSADLAARKGTSASGGIEEGINALSNIYLKGGISKKQLVGLGVERSKDFYGSIAAQKGVSEKQAEKNVQEGKYDPQFIVNELAKAVEKQQGGKLGTGSAQYADTFESKFERLKDLPDEFFRKMVDSPGFDKVKESFDSVLKRLDPDSEEGKKIIAGLTDAFGKVSDVISKALTPENVQKFANAVILLIEAVTKVAGAFSPALNAVDKISRYENGGKEIFEKAKKAEGAGFFDSITGSQKRDILQKAYKDNFITADEIQKASPAAAAAMGVGKNGGASITGTIVNVKIDGTQGDAAEHGKKVAGAIADTLVSQFEAARAQGGL